eukprot:GGOE01028806.1.p1 GENE.GGOE01028806.1~~GGOE01028806.1.p1  ORF type:complete len:297 (-),score=30.56 GGOE01028806.1:1140-1925(-)
MVDFSFPDLLNADSVLDSDVEFPGMSSSDTSRTSSICSLSPSLGLQGRRRNRLMPLPMDSLQAAGPAPDVPHLPPCPLSLCLIGGSPHSSSSRLLTPSSYEARFVADARGSLLPEPRTPPPATASDVVGRPLFSDAHHSPDSLAMGPSVLGRDAVSALCPPFRPCHSSVRPAGAAAPTLRMCCRHPSGSPNASAACLPLPRHTTQPASGHPSSYLQNCDDVDGDNDNEVVELTQSPTATQCSPCGPLAHRRKQQYTFVIRR